jgi:hypothetical protein
MLARCPLPGAQLVHIFDPQWQTFYRLVNAGNHLAFGGLGMPAWVQLDCATLPSAMIGFAARRADIPEALWRDLLGYVERNFGAEAHREAQSWTGLVPISEYAAVPSAQPDTWVGYSLYALSAQVGLGHVSLGMRTKALAMLCYGAQRQVGMTQYHNKAVRTHASFGPLFILEPHARPHSQPEDTFVYRVNLDDARHLEGLLHGQRPAPSAQGATLQVRVTPGQAARQIEALVAKHGPLTLVPPGSVRDDQGHTSLLLRPATQAER